jgi:hypothetical protein
MKIVEFLGGEHLSDALSEAVRVAVAGGEAVQFEFNGQTYISEPSDTYETAKVRAEQIFGHPILTRQETSERASESLKKMQDDADDAIAKANVPTEAQMRALDAPWPETMEDLTAFIKTLVDRPHDYGTCVYAMSLAATATYHHVAKVLGVTGFQASCADMDILRRTRHLEGPFILLNAEDMLYPQYDLHERLEEFIQQSRPWAAEEARKKLIDSPSAAERVRERWEEMAAYVTPQKDTK